jgi:hypothetical protein
MACPRNSRERHRQKASSERTQWTGARLEVSLVDSVATLCSLRVKSLHRVRSHRASRPLAKKFRLSVHSTMRRASPRIERRSRCDRPGRISTSAWRESAESGTTVKSTLDLGEEGVRMTCTICRQEVTETKASPESHHLERAPLGDSCLGCFIAGIELEKFLDSALLVLLL